MSKLVIFILVFIILFSLYKIFALIYYYYYLRIKLKNANLDTFIKILGGSFRYRVVYDGVIRYKWIKGLLIVRATFDTKGNLVNTERAEYNFKKPNTEFTFSK